MAARGGFRKPATCPPKGVVHKLAGQTLAKRARPRADWINQMLWPDNPEQHGGGSVRIEPIQPEQAVPEVQRIYRSLEERLGGVSNFYKVLAHKPALLRAFTQLYGAIWDDGALDPRLKELAYLRASIVNGCDYWTRSHTASGKRRGLTDEQIGALKEPGGRRRAGVFSADELAILRFTDLLTSYPGNVDDEDLDVMGRYLSAEQLIELVATIATANWTNRINDGLRTPITWRLRNAGRSSIGLRPAQPAGAWAPPAGKRLPQ
jgi:uncharacterized peroxidase-related enzyme